MTIEFIGEGNLLSCKLQTIACPVNTVGVMGAGLALAMKLRIPGLFDFYVAACKDKRLTVDRPVVYPVPDSDKQVLLFATKKHWRQPSELKYIQDGIDYVVENYKDLGITELGIPALGCGLGQLDFLLCLKPLLEKTLVDCDLPVYVLLHKTRR